MKEKEHPQKLIPQKRQKNQKPISLMTINAKFENKTLENKTRKNIKIISQVEYTPKISEQLNINSHIIELINKAKGKKIKLINARQSTKTSITD